MKNLIKHILLLLALLPVTAAAHDFEVGGIYYKINGNEATVTFRGSYYYQYSNEYSGDITIPSTVTYNGTTYSVTSIGDYAFRDCRELTSVTILNSVTNISNSAFYGCSRLTNANIGNSVTNIGDYAFYYCSALTSIDIPNSVTTIGRYAFFYCSALTSVNIPNSVTNIGNSAFSGCTSLACITVDSGNPIYDSRFNCNAIIETATNTMIAGCKNTVIPNSVTSIGDDAFLCCSGLISIDIPNSVTNIGNSAFSGCSGITSVNIPNSVTNIGNNAFEYCSELTSVTIGNSVTSIGYNAFRDCSGLTSVNITDIAAWCNISFDGYDSNPLDNAHHIYLNGLEVTELTIPNSVASIGSYAFSDCSGITSVNIPNSVTNIGNSAFYGCSSLTDVYSNIADPSVISMGNDVFYLYNVDYSKRTLHVPIGSLAAYQADTNWEPYFDTIVEMAPTVGNTFTIESFQYCITSDSTVAVTKCYYPSERNPNPQKTISSESTNTNLRSERGSFIQYDIPSIVTYNGEYYAVTSIGDSAFYCNNYYSSDSDFGCKEYSVEITIPETVTSIGYNAFGGLVETFSIYYLSKTPPSINYSFDGTIFLYVLPEAYSQFIEINDEFHFFSHVCIIGEISDPIEYETEYYYNPFNYMCYGCRIKLFPKENCVIYMKETQYFPYYGESVSGPWQTINQYVIEYIYDGISNHGWWASFYAIEEGKCPSEVIRFGHDTFQERPGTSFDFMDSDIGFHQYDNSAGVTSRIYYNPAQKLNGYYDGDSFYNSNIYYDFYSGDVVIPSTAIACDYNGYTICSVESIEEYAFSINKGIINEPDIDNITLDELHSVTLPESINYISYSAFGDCPNLTFIKCLGMTPPYAEGIYYDEHVDNYYYGSFDHDVLQNTILYVPIGAVDAYKNAEGWKDFQHIVGFIDYDFEVDGVYYKLINDGNVMVTRGEDAYQGVVNIPSIVTYEGAIYNVTYIGDSIFADATLQSLILPVTIGTIGESAFNGCHIGSIVITGNGAWNAGAINCEIDGLFVMSGVTGIQGLQMSPTTVYSYSTVPPTCDSGSFTGYDAALHVPASALAAYFTAPYWSNFINITSDAIEPTGLSINKDSIELLIGNQLSLTATPTPANATPANAIIWTSTNDSIATVVYGAITAARVGECDIKAVLLDKIATCHVTVTEIPPTSVTINPEFAKLESGTQLTLTATVLPEDATDKVVTWESTNSAVATVSSEGIVTAVAPGECFITATCRDNQATCHIIVVDHFIYVSLDEHNVRLLPNHMITLTPSVIPEGTNLVVTSSNPTVAAARMANGIIQVVGITEGKTVINVNSTDGYAEADSCLVTVYTERGDVNCDGFINISDVTSLVNRLLTGQSASISEVNADTNNDGQLSIADVTRLINHLLSGNELDPKEEPDNDGLSITSSVPMVALSPWERHPSKALSAPGIE